MKVLLILAGGKSTRFSNKPKVLTEIQPNLTNLENTVNKAKKYYDKIILALEENEYKKINLKFDGIDIIPVIGGYGDGYSLLKALETIHYEHPEYTRINLIWGDAVVKTEMPFIQFNNGELSDIINYSVAVSNDKEPYAWFETDNNRIIKSHFKKIDGIINNGIHDQSLFAMDILTALNDLIEYTTIIDIHKEEMKLLYFFEFIKTKGKYCYCVNIDSGNVLSFNTEDELNKIRKVL